MMDLVVSAPRRPLPGETLVGTDFAMRLGGKGFNQAVSAARAGAKASMVGLLGNDDFGAAFRVSLDAEGVDSEWVGVSDRAGTGVGLPIVEPDGQNSIIIVPRANAHVNELAVEAARDAVAAADVLLLQLELPVAAAVAAAGAAREAGTVVVLNPAPMTVLPELLLECVDVLVPNEVELDALAGRTVGDDVVEAACALRARWDVDVVVTLGRRGVLVAPRMSEPVWIDGHAVEAIDTVGAGDTFCGYLGAGLAAGDDLVTAAVRANAAAAISVTRPGSATSAPVADEVVGFAAGDDGLDTDHPRAFAEDLT
jgi:ribokinase